MGIIYYGKLDNMKADGGEDNGVLHSWNEQHEEILKEWKAKCFVNLWLQDASSYFYTKLYNWLSYPVIIVSSLSSAALFSSDNLIIKYIVGVMTLSSGILTAITRQLKPGELHQQHSLTTRRYHNLIRSIDTCLSLTVPMRPQPSTFIEKIGLEIDTLAASQLDPPLKIIKQFEKKFGPLDRMLYGEDIVELMKIEMQANKMFKKMRKNERLSDEISVVVDPTIETKQNRYQRERYDKFTKSISNLDAAMKHDEDSIRESPKGDSVMLDINKLIMHTMSRDGKKTPE